MRTKINHPDMVAFSLFQFYPLNYCSTQKSTYDKVYHLLMQNIEIII